MNKSDMGQFFYRLAVDGRERAVQTNVAGKRGNVEREAATTSLCKN